MHIIENGNVAAALGVKLCRANVIAAYPSRRRLLLRKGFPSMWNQVK